MKGETPKHRQDFESHRAGRETRRVETGGPLTFCQGGMGVLIIYYLFYLCFFFFFVFFFFFFFGGGLGGWAVGLGGWAV